MHAAYDALPERLKERIAPLKVAFRYGGRERKWFDLLEPADQARPPAVHDLAELYWYMLQPNAECRHKWQKGDIVLWDNRCTVHSAAGGYSADERRIHWRTTIMQ
jgi:hypothetical protein